MIRINDIVYTIGALSDYDGLVLDFIVESHKIIGIVNNNKYVLSDCGDMPFNKNDFFTTKDKAEKYGEKLVAECKIKRVKIDKIKDQKNKLEDKINKLERKFSKLTAL